MTADLQTVEDLDVQIEVHEAALRDLRAERLQLAQIGNPIAGLVQWWTLPTSRKSHAEVNGWRMCQVGREGETLTPDKPGADVCWQCYKRTKAVITTVVKLSRLVPREDLVVRSAPHLAATGDANAMCGATLLDNAPVVDVAYHTTCRSCRKRAHALADSVAQYVDIERFTT